METATPPRVNRSTCPGPLATKFAPETETCAPPAVGPDAGLIESTRGAGTTVGVAVAVQVGVRVAVFEDVGVGVLVRVGVRVAVGPAGVAVGVFVRVLVRVLVGVTVEVGCAVGVRVAVSVAVGVAPRVTETTADALLFPMKGSGSLPMTPTTAVSVPGDSGTTRITRLLNPAAAHVTVVDNSADAVLAAQIPAGTDESSVTFGKNTAVTVTLAAPLEPPIPTVNAAAVPTVAPPGPATPTDRSRGV